MTNKARQRAIVETLESGREYSVGELAALLQTSEISVRRDLVVLAGKGLVERTHGGAMKPDKAGYETKQLSHSNEKIHIGKLAAGMVEAGDVIFLDCGSTVFQMCRFLKNIEELTVVTNSIPVLHELLAAPSISINLIGGEIDRVRKAVHGTTALSHIKRYHCRKAFIGVDGLSLKSGLTARSEKEASISTAMMEQADETYLLCDSSKIEKESYLQFASLSVISTIITDQNFPSELMDAYQRSGVKVLN